MNLNGGVPIRRTGSPVTLGVVLPWIPRIQGSWISGDTVNTKFYDFGAKYWRSKRNKDKRH